MDTPRPSPADNKNALMVRALSRAQARGIPMERPTLPTMDVSSKWLQAVVLTFLFGFAILGYLAIRIYQESPPVPGRIVSDSGQTVFTENDIRAGQESFLTYGLMQYGSIYGHGAYLGPDFTADYLHREAEEMIRDYGGDAEARARTQMELRANRYEASTDTLTFSDGRARAFDVLRRHYEESILNRAESGGGGLGPHAVK